MSRPLPRTRPRSNPTARRLAPAIVVSSSRLTIHASRAFTLLEVLVALAVLALALGALVRAGGEQARSLDHLRTRSFAEWVAADQLARARLAETWPDTGTRRGVTHMGQRQWHWRQSVSPTEDEDIRRIEITVRMEPESEAPVTTLAGFIGRF